MFEAWMVSCYIVINDHSLKPCLWGSLTTRPISNSIHLSNHFATLTIDIHVTGTDSSFNDRINKGNYIISIPRILLITHPWKLYDDIKNRLWMLRVQSKMLKWDISALRIILPHSHSVQTNKLNVKCSMASLVDTT